MSPAKSCEINGPRPSPLLINKDSRLIRKPSNPSSSYTSHADGAAVKLQQRQPVIIYTHSPKIIHTQPKDFMALVQRLTGFTRSNVDEGTVAPPPRPQRTVTKSSVGNIDVGIIAGHNDNDSSSVLTEENCGGNCSGMDVQATSSYGSPTLKKVHSNTYLADIPLFTPRSTDLFSSPRRLLRYPDAPLAPPNLGGSMSPSLVEFLKGLPEF